ncbi:flagellar hook-length control protein FliK [Bowmanella dokdonensis]|uniref:Flagellar hook-length control protein FliK n=1 Tax=Bowmanella dokdonensis TaxID=751969 RepID=A0A939IQK6_9ALTE|nr:flagellar hook-length control protein FliK [Bowmanella dokdonensis]MBN7827040.1 flagellar hook-length control protein FliK [Bowmanella dokdonensis]
MMQQIAATLPKIATQGDAAERNSLAGSAGGNEQFSTHLSEQQKQKLSERDRYDERHFAEPVRPKPEPRRNPDRPVEHKGQEAEKKTSSVISGQASQTGEKSIKDAGQAETSEAAAPAEESQPPQNAKGQTEVVRDPSVQEKEEKDQASPTLLGKTPDESENDYVDEEWLKLVYQLMQVKQSQEVDRDAEAGVQLTDEKAPSFVNGSELESEARELLVSLGLDSKALMASLEEAGKLQEFQTQLTQWQKQELTPQQILSQLAEFVSPGRDLSTGGKIPVDWLSEPMKQQLQATLSQQAVLPESINAEDLALLASPSGEKVDLAIQSKLGTGSTESDSKGKSPVISLEVLAGLPEQELDKNLQNLVDRLPVKDMDPEIARSFIASLKAGIEEYRSQQKQGREPGLDLQSLVAASLPKEMAGTEEMTQKVQQMVQQLSAMPETASMARNEAAEPLRLVTEKVAGLETQSLMADTSKPATAQQLSQFDKAINIAKPEAAIQLAERVRLLVNQGNMSADIRLDPPDLGSMQIRINMQGDQASVSFVVQNQQARDMLDQAVPRLREMLAEKGIELGQSSVQQDSKGRQPGDTEQQLASGQSEDAEQMGPESAAELKVVNGALGGIDYFV